MDTIRDANGAYGLHNMTLDPWDATNLEAPSDEEYQAFFSGPTERIQGNTGSAAARPHEL